MNKTEKRDLTYKLLYSLEIQKNVDIDEQIELYIEENNVEKESIKRYNQGEALFVCGNRRMQIDVVLTPPQLDSFGTGGGL